MNKCQVSLVLLVSLICLMPEALGERPSHMLKARRSSYIAESGPLARSSDAGVSLPLDQEKLTAAIGVGAGNGAGAGAGVAGAAAGGKDPSSGRLFLKKFLTFKNMFSSSNQPVIPIIITGGGTGSGITSPTSPVTVTSTGTIPSATGTITSSPTSPTSPTTASRGYGDDLQNDELAEDDDDAAEQGQEQHDIGGVAMAANAELLDEQAMQAAIAAGAQEYEVFTDGDQADESKASQNNRINLRRKGSRRGAGQVISVRIPPRYRRYFKNGQKVMLNTKSRPIKRRVVRKRYQANNKRFNNRRRGGKNKNKKNRGKGKNKNKRPRIPMV